MGEYVIALDQGTTSSRAVLIDRLGRIKGMPQSPFPPVVSAARLGGAFSERHSFQSA